MANKRKKPILKWLILLVYIGCAITIIVESCIPGASSASQSDAVGGSLSDIINDISKDQTKFVNVEKVQIDNKIDSAYIGDTYQIQTSITPTDATNQSLIYSSSDANIASVTETGLIHFKNQGNVLITVQSAFDESKKDSMLISVFEVLPTQLSVTIENAIFEEQKEAYILYIGQNYPIKVNFLPENTTNLSFTVTTSYTKNAIEIQNDVIVAKHYNNLELIPIEVISNANPSVKSCFNILVDYSEVIEPQSISFLEGNSSELYVGATKRLNIAFQPSNVSFFDVSYETLDASIATFNNGIIQAIRPGKTMVIARSVRNPSIYASHEITVLPLPQLEDFLVSNSMTLVVGTSKKISITKNPSNAAIDTTLFTYQSENNEIATVSQQGIVYGIQPGKTNITVTYDQKIEKQMIVEVIEKENVSITDIQVHFKNIVSVNEIVSDFINLSYLPANATSLGDAFEFIPLNFNDLSEEEKEEFSQYNLEEWNTNDLIEYDANTNQLNVFNHEGIAFFKIYHLASGIMSDLLHIEIHEILPIDLQIYQNGEELSNITYLQANTPTITLFVDIKQAQDATYKELNWELIPIEGEDIARLELTENGNQYRNLVIINEGVFDIKVSICTPILQSHIDKTIRFYVAHEDLSIFQITNIEDASHPEIILDNYNMYKNTSIPLGIYTNQNYTRLLLQYSSSNPQVATISSDGLLTAKNCGSSTIRVTNLYNQEEVCFQLTVYNRLSLAESNTYTLSGNTLKKIGENKYQFTNGNSISLTIHYAEDATYKSVTFQSSNEKVATIGADGIITPHQVGTTTITVTYTDGFSVETPFEFTIDLKIVKKPLITDIQSFTSFIRKALGHFGVFFILGIFSLFTYALFFKKRQWLYSIPIHFASGYFIAVLSEFIQLYVPGRGGAYKDVMIDYSGYLISTFFIIFIYLLIFTCKYFIQKKKNKPMPLEKEGAES